MQDPVKIVDELFAHQTSVQIENKQAIVGERAEYDRISKTIRIGKHTDPKLITHEKIHAVIDTLLGSNEDLLTFEDAFMRNFTEEYLNYSFSSILDIRDIFKQKGEIFGFSAHDLKDLENRKKFEILYSKRFFENFFSRNAHIPQKTLEIIFNYRSYLRDSGGSPSKGKCISTLGLIDAFPKMFGITWNNIFGVGGNEAIHLIHQPNMYVMEVKKMLPDDLKSKTKDIDKM